MPSSAERLFRAARRLHRRSGAGLELPPLLFFTDPLRTPDPVAIARRLPRGAGVVYRSFGASDRNRMARALQRVCRLRGLKLLIGADAVLARRIGADGVHLPERLLRPGKAPPTTHLLTAAAHSARALRRAALCKAQAAVLSPVFASASPSAGTPLGPRRARALVAGIRPLPVYALGGIKARHAPIGCFCGLAAIGALRT